MESRRNLLSAWVATRSDRQSWGHVIANRQGTVAGWMTVSTKLDQGQESGNHSRVLIDRCDQSLLISVFDKLTWASVAVSSCRMRTCHHAGRACVGVRLSGAPARRLMSPDEPTSDDPKNCKRASPLQASLTGLSEANDTLDRPVKQMRLRAQPV